ncbi:MAG: D-alanyl-D-alanine carboxypeptidase/D-alanyl-D-alanine endopeptidase [Jiangellaceae bacterium]
MSRRSVAIAAAALVLLGGAVAGVVAFELDRRPDAEPTPSPSVSETPSPSPEPQPSVLAAASSTPAPGMPSLAEVLGPELAAGALGDRVGASVVDLTSGASLYEVEADTALVPASTLKILTAAAALDVLGPDRTFTTSVVSGSGPGEVVLVGGGDPTLTVRDGPPTRSATRLAALADDTAAALTATGTTTVGLFVDDSLFSGPAIDPDWRSTYVPSGAVGPVSALAVDGGRVRPDRDARSSDPTLAAAAAFADMLTDRGIIVVAEPVRGTAVRGTTDLAAVESAPLSAIVEDMLSTSDNDAAEVLARHTARATGRPATADAASLAVAEAVTALGVDLSGAAVLDASGLARGNGIPAAALTATLAAAADPERPELRPVLTGLPVAAFTGTLHDRFGGDATTGAGVVRAKTGTLSAVSSLAGVVVARSGTAYAFAVLADDVANAFAARDTLDRVAATLAGCGCGGTTPAP